ncbi:BcsR/BcsP family cellulose biosynthesis protein [Telmatospirillum siberiense]|uniref:Uncharacterized protein n=1 Tax=Telmatospirillum siberiense TaxID=382514 RepID=A0A2N3PZB1_9PROT|nr:BcsR/BcsP family cellulose biosynthesis protein [Telmatospirillum siberiense]PKU25746.1 hypothetical protein CWS72_04045 [Telmatospirillum siberiense]
MVDFRNDSPREPRQDIANLLEAIGEAAFPYRELRRTPVGDEAAARWPLIQSLAREVIRPTAVAPDNSAQKSDLAASSPVGEPLPALKGFSDSPLFSSFSRWGKEPTGAEHSKDAQSATLAAELRNLLRKQWEAEREKAANGTGAVSFDEANPCRS